MLINGSLGWLRIAELSFYALYYRYLQKNTKCYFGDVFSQERYLRTIQRLGTTIQYPIFSKNETVSHSVLLFLMQVAVMTMDSYYVLSGIVIGPLCKDYIFYTLHWQSHHFRRPAKSTHMAEILACSEAIEEGNGLKNSLAQILGITILHYIVVDSKYSYSSISKRQNSVVKLIRSDVNSSRFELKQIR